MICSYRAKVTRLRNSRRTSNRNFCRIQSRNAIHFVKRPSLGFLSCITKRNQSWASFHQTLRKQSHRQCFGGTKVLPDISPVLKLMIYGKKIVICILSRLLMTLGWTILGKLCRWYLLLVHTNVCHSRDIEEHDRLAALDVKQAGL